MSSTIELAKYLFTRLKQLGVQSVHGVPGDYNLALLDYVEPDLHWVGNCNELNAGYAADGYSRIKGLGALITTFGVGELSAINAIAGAYAELAPVIHIVGTPARHLSDSRALIHHTFNDGEYGRFAQMHTHITVAQASLRDPRTAPLQIDTAIQQCLIHSRPVYIDLPADMVAVPVAAERLQSSIELPPAVTAKDEEKALGSILKRIYASQRPMILVDGESKAYGILEELHQLIKTTQWPTWTSVFGKSLVEEDLSNFCGIWKGSSATQEEQDFVKSRDLILCFGPHFSTTNSYLFSSIPEPTITVLFKQTSITGPDQTFRDVPMKTFLSNLLNKLEASKLSEIEDFSRVAKTRQATPTESSNIDGPITHEQFYHTVSDFFRPGDVILAETGTVGVGSREFRLPAHTHLIKPATWLSIGYMLPAAQGAALAQRELHGDGKWYRPKTEEVPRTILFIGDGSFQMTAQELSTIIREKLNVVVFLINNDGYTIERCLHGFSQRYNDIANWQYLLAPAFFGASTDANAEYSGQTFKAENRKELQDVLGNKDMTKATGLKMVEVFMGKLDAPTYLLNILHQQDNVPSAQQ